MARVHTRASDTGSRNETIDTEIERLAAATALILIFVQANWTAAKSAEMCNSTFCDLAPTPGVETPPLGLLLGGERMHTATVQMLRADGEDANVNTKAAHCLLLARTVLGAPSNFKFLSNAANWWHARLAALNQRLLIDCPSSSLDQQVMAGYKVAIAATKGAAGTFVGESAIIDGHDIEALAQQELAVYGYWTKQREIYTNAVSAAKTCSKLSWSLDGMLGVRTKHQTEKRAQLIVRHSSYRSVCADTALYGFGTDQVKELPNDVPLDDDTLLPEVRLEEDCLGLQASMIDQAVIMIEGLGKELLEANDEALRNEQLRPFTRLLTCQPRSLWCIRATALWMRSTIESGKRRTSPRALSQLRSLQSEIVGQKESGSLAREALFFAVPFPTQWELQRAIALGYCKEGIFELAGDIFLEIQSWHDVIDCYTAVNQVEKAESIVRSRLQVEPSPRLWCALGELCERSRIGKAPLPNDSDDAISCYKHALSIDYNYTHAHRCLAKVAYQEKRFDDVIRHLETAVSLNSLSLPSWYTLGCTALQTQQWQKARKAFTHYVQAKPDDGEGYANLSVALVRLKCKEEAYVVLTEGVRHAWTNWKVWHNYVPLCVDTGHFSAAIRALQRLVDLGHTKEAVDIPVISALVQVRHCVGLVCCINRFPDCVTAWADCRQLKAEDEFRMPQE